MDDAQTQTDPDGRYARGLAAISQVTGTERPTVLDPLAEIAPDLARYTVEFGFGDIWSRLAGSAKAVNLGLHERCRGRPPGSSSSGQEGQRSHDLVLHDRDVTERQDRHTGPIGAPGCCGKP